MKNLAPSIAYRQNGVFTAAQAADEGASRRQIEYRISQGLWQRVAGRGFALESFDIGPPQLAAAACLTWPQSIVCLDIAAELHSIPVTRGSVVLRDDRQLRSVHVYVPTGRRAARGIIPHKRDLLPVDIATRGPIRFTSKTTTVLDCLALLDWRAAQGVSSWAVTHKLLTPELVTRALAANPGIRGAAQQRVLLARMSSGAASAEELRLHDILRDTGFVDWEPNASVRVDGGRLFCVDVLFIRTKLVIELDGPQYHGADRRGSDLQRHASLVAAGYTVIRLTPKELDDPFGIVNRILGSPP